LEIVNRGEEIRALVKIRYGNMEKENKWPEDRQRRCVFCDEGKEEKSLEHYVKDCQRIKEWFVELEERIIDRIVREDLDEIKNKVIRIMGEKEIRY